MEQDAFPWLRRRPIAEIDAPEVLACLRITGERPMSDNTINVALRRMGFDRETATAHGFRAMARTRAVERLGIAAEVIEAQLALAKSGPLGAAHDRAQCLDQRRDLMKRWADHLDQSKAGSNGSGGAVGRHPADRRGDG